MDVMSAESAHKCEAACKEADSAKAKCNKLTIQCDVATQERNLFVAENNNHVKRITELETEVLVLRHEIDDLLKKQRKTDELLPVYVERQSRLTERVSALEMQQREVSIKIFMCLLGPKHLHCYI
jgi:uncharacterized coiled-coil DUF342 family protein